MTQKFDCFLIGDGTLLQECGNVLLREGHQILGVITSSDILKSWAISLGINAIDSKTEFSEAMESCSFDYLFSITYLKKIDRKTLSLPKMAAINFHDGPLPKYAGLNTPAWALMNGEKSYGVCWHRMTDEIDRGAILKRENFEIDSDETSVSLNMKNLIAGVRSFEKLVNDISSNNISEEKQSGLHQHYYKKFDRPNAVSVLDWRKAAKDLDNQVRGLEFGVYENPLGSPKIIVGGEAYIVDQTRVIEQNSSRYSAEEISGRIIEVNEEKLIVGAGDGKCLEISGLRYLNGTKANIGELTAGKHDLIASYSNEERENLSKIDNQFSRSEAFWADRLSTLNPIPATLSRESTKTLIENQDVQQALDLPGIVLNSEVDQIIVSSIFFLLLARLERQFDFDIAFLDDEWFRKVKNFQKLISIETLVRISIDPHQNWQSYLTKIKEEISSVRLRGSWLYDIVNRKPILRDLNEAPSTDRLNVGVIFVDSILDWYPNSEKHLTLICPKDKSAPLLVGNSKHYDRESLSILAELVENLAYNIHQMESGFRLNQLPILKQESFQKIDEQWNISNQSLVDSSNIYSQIEEQVSRTPQCKAVWYENSYLTYHQLNEQASELADRLKKSGVRRNSLVGIHLNRSLEMVVAVLAVLKSGGAYVPLDPEFPMNRLNYMIEDSGLTAVITQKSLQENLTHTEAEIILVEDRSENNNKFENQKIESSAKSDDLAYVMYTSGSTGNPKGVMVTQHNVLNFFRGMDEKLDGGSPGNWLAVTSLSFDISVLELMWTLARGFTVVIQGGIESYFSPLNAPSSKPMGFSLFMWGNDDSPGREKYKLMLEGAKYFDENEFDAVWTPERHFHAFGGPYPNPSVTGAALAAITNNIGIRAGSCVSPLHHPIRIAEEWSVVDNLSDGRVAIAFASGWQPNDFILQPKNHPEAKAIMFDHLATVKKLWRGEKVLFENPLGENVEIETLPRPVQPELPYWITTAGNPETYRQAGESGANVLTHLLGQSVDELADKISIYRKAREDAGFDPDTGRVSLMLHTFVGENNDQVRELVRSPMKEYLRSSLRLALGYAWSFPAFKRPGNAADKPEEVDISKLSEEEIDALLEFAFDRYFDNSGLFGTPEKCLQMINSCKKAGVDEIACLLDFGVETEIVMKSLPNLNILRKLSNKNVAHKHSGTGKAESFTIASQIERHGITHIQCTPSLARMLLMDSPTRNSLSRINKILVGGEEMTTDLATELTQSFCGELFNMYGPTETTIWSSVHSVSPLDNPIPIGKPISNTQLYVLDAFGWPVPNGVPGELFIGGEGVTRGYLNRTQLTEEKFQSIRFFEDSNSKIYQTGDLVKITSANCIEFLGRVDSQIKIRGYRVEPEEIERILSGHQQIGEAAVILHSTSDYDARLIAYITRADEDKDLDTKEILNYTESQLPSYMIPSEFFVLESMPLTPNRKIDRKALPRSNVLSHDSSISYEPPGTATEIELADVWGQLLKLDKIGVNDNFFEIGGHSLLAMQLIEKIEIQFGVHVPLQILFQQPTITQLSLALDALKYQQANNDLNSGTENREEFLL